MRRIAGSVAALGLTVGLMSGCSGPEVHDQEAQVFGYGAGQDVDVIQPQWVHYENTHSLPRGEVRDLSSDNVFDGCHAENDSFLSLNINDSECGGIFYDACAADDNEHCVADYRVEYDYDRWEDVVIRSCVAVIQKHEVRPIETSFDRNEDCIGQVQYGQYEEPHPARYVLWLVTDNPDYDPEKPADKPISIRSHIEVEPSTWYNAERGTPVDVKIRSGEIIEATVSDTSE